MQNVWPELPAEVSAKVEAAIASGNKIEAIKIYREATHCGLKEAKDAIERADGVALTAGSNPIVTKTTGPSLNWLTIILVLIAFAIVAAIFLFHNR